MSRIVEVVMVVASLGRTDFVGSGVELDLDVDVGKRPDLEASCVLLFLVLDIPSRILSRGV